MVVTVVVAAAALWFTVAVVDNIQEADFALVVSRWTAFRLMDVDSMLN